MQTEARNERLQLASALNAELSTASAKHILDRCCNELFGGKIALVSSFGSESAVLIHLTMQACPETPVIFLDTHKHFPETLQYVTALKNRLSIETLTITKPRDTELKGLDPSGTLHASDSDACCHIRKTLPMVRALNPYDAWITGRKRFQSAGRQSLDIVEFQDGWLKVNPLASWRPKDLLRVARSLDLPPHPLVARGFMSIGCKPCTSAISSDDADPRSGRWAGTEKTECGIHFEDGKMVRNVKEA